MLDKLRFDLELKPYPYPNDIIGRAESWGRISINVVRDTQEIPLLNSEWILVLFAAWFAGNKDNLSHETLSIAGNNSLPSESLAQALNRLQRDFAESEEEAKYQWFSSLFEFRQRHSLRCALRGAAIPDIIIGYNRGSGEISLSEENEEWSYQFDMNDFCLDLQRKLERIEQMPTFSN